MTDEEYINVDTFKEQAKDYITEADSLLLFSINEDKNEHTTFCYMSDKELVILITKFLLEKGFIDIVNQYAQQLTEKRFIK